MKSIFSNFFKLRFKALLIFVAVCVTSSCIGTFSKNIVVGVGTNADDSQPRVYSSESSDAVVNNSNARSRVNSSPSNESRVRVYSSSDTPQTQSNTTSSSTASNSVPSTPSASTFSNSSSNSSPNTPQQTIRRESQPQNNSSSEAAPIREEKNLSQNVAPQEATPKEKDKGESAEEKPKPPEDLPKVEDEEISFPEVATPVNAEKESKTNYVAGIIAWSCILAGISMVVFIMIKGKSNADVPIQGLSGIKRRRRRGKHLLPDNYYREKF